LILLTGATGFTGRFVCDVLLDRGLPFRCVVRDPAKARSLVDRGVPCVSGDVRDEGAIRRALEGCSGVINLVEFNQGHVAMLLHEAARANARRALFVSATAIFTRLDAPSKALRERAEAEIARSGLDWTVLRPTMIYGARGDRNMERLAAALRRYPVHPILGTGDRLLQPIHVRDLARAVVDAYVSEKTVSCAFNLSGKNALTYRDSVREVARLLEKPVWMFSLPTGVAILAAEVSRRIPGLPKINGEQVERLNEDKAFSHDEASKAWGFDPMDFSTGIRMELEDLGLLGR
jgi:uncharacterized protein YbjT (DUF2867 family)